MGLEVCTSQSDKGVAVGRLNIDGIHSNSRLSAIRPHLCVMHTTELSGWFLPAWPSRSFLQIGDGRPNLSRGCHPPAFLE